MPAAQRKVSIGEVRFTLPFGRTITIAARSGRESPANSASSCATGVGAERPVAGHDERQREFRDGSDRSTLPKSKKRLWGRSKRRAPNARAAGTSAFRGNAGVPGNEAPGNVSVPGNERPGERGRRRTRQDQISRWALGPVKLRSKDSAPNEENLFLLPDRL